MFKIANRGYSVVAACSFAVGVTAIVALLAAEKFYWTGSTIFSEGRPDFSGERVARSALIFAALALILGSLKGAGTLRIALSEGRDDPLENVSMGSTLALSVVCTALFVSTPSAFSRASEEDGLVEWASAGLLFASSLIFVVNFLRHRKSSSVPRWAAWWLLAFAFVFFVIGMEEVSWFQRVLGIKTPAMFGENLQREMNLHNFAGNQVENAYYLGAFAFLVVAPLLRSLFFASSDNFCLQNLAPATWLVVPGAVACAYNYDMWDVIFIQMAFFGAVVTLAMMATMCARTRDRVTLVAALLVVLVSQFIYINRGEDYARIWEITEYKELFIPLGFFWYAVSVYSAVRRASHRVP